MSTTHPVDLRYTKEELLTIFAIATKEDVDPIHLSPAR